MIVLMFLSQALLSVRDFAVNLTPLYGSDQDIDVSEYCVSRGLIQQDVC